MRALCVIAVAVLHSFGWIASAHAQLGCFRLFRGCVAENAFEDLATCTAGTDCASNVCVFDEGGAGRCLLPQDQCEWCFVGPPLACPDVSVAGRPRQSGDLEGGGCDYAICGSISYRVDTTRPTVGSLGPCFTGPLWDLWGGGDCDSDGVPNRLDVGDSVCIPNVPVGRVPGTDLVRCVGDLKTMGATSECTGVSPRTDLVGCSVVTETFGICCVTDLACPLLPEVGPPRCVRLPTAPGDPPAGVCTYGGGTGVDESCLSIAPTVACDAVGEETGYLRWARGNCDAACDSVQNELSSRVCGCEPDAGVDAWAPDAFVVPEPDAWAPDMDAGVVSAMDAAVAPDAARTDTGPGSFSFSGAGCRCVVGVGGRRGASAVIVTLVLVSVATSIRSRRRRAQ